MSGNNMGRYPNASVHMTRAGVGIEEAADLTKLSTASIRRIVKGESVRATTIAKLINALNDRHYKANPPILVFENEFVPDHS
jgi:hypothetical protein